MSDRDALERAYAESRTPGAVRDYKPTHDGQEDSMETMDPKANPAGYWMREVAQTAREAAARMIRLADDLDASAAKSEQAALARQAATR